MLLGLMEQMQSHMMDVQALFKMALTFKEIKMDQSGVLLKEKYLEL